MKVLAFAASNSSRSINKKLVTYATRFLSNAEVELLDLNDYEMPLFSVDREDEIGEHEVAKRFLAKIAEVDGIMISFAEHNSSYTVAYKNVFDWSSRINGQVYQNKPMVLFSTSNGRRGGMGVLGHAAAGIPFQGGIVKGTLSVPSFKDNFNQETGEITDPDLQKQIQAVVASLFA